MTNSTSGFNLVPAEACTCCGRELSQGYDVPYIGVVGPRCVRKFAPLAQALAMLERTEFAAQLTGERGAATQRVFYALRRLGFDPQAVTTPDGACTIVIHKLPAWRNAAKVCKSWRERRAEFERDLQVAGGAAQAPAAAPAPEAPVLTLEALSEMTPAQRRVVAVEHGVLTPSGKSSTSVALIWAAVQLAQTAEAVAEVAPLKPVLVLENPVTGPAFLPYQIGPFQQIEQQQAQRAAPPQAQEPTRLERLSRLHFLCVVSELSAEPCTPERASRGHRADRVAFAYRAERALAPCTEPCGVCGRPGRAQTGLCLACQDSWDREMAEGAAWAGAAHPVPRQQPEQRHFAQAAPEVLGDDQRPAIWATPENCHSSYAMREAELREARVVLPTAHPHIFQLGLRSPLWGLRVHGQDYRVTQACIGYAVTHSTTTLLTVEGFSASVSRNDLRALAAEVARELGQDGPHQQEEQQQAQGGVRVELGGTGSYAADLYGQTFPDVYARVEVNECQEADPKHMPVILHLPNAMLLELSAGGDEAEVTLNMTALEVRVLSAHLLKAAQAAEGGAQ